MAAVHFGSCAFAQPRSLEAFWSVFRTPHLHVIVILVLQNHESFSRVLSTRHRLPPPSPQIAISRTLDYRHNFSDVIAGAMIGSFAAYAAYFCHCTCICMRRHPTPPRHIYQSILFTYSHILSRLCLPWRHICIWQIMRWTRRSATSRFPFWID